MEQITSKNYVENVLKTEPKELDSIRARLQSDTKIRLIHASDGMVTEAGEFKDAIKKHIFYGKPIDIKNLQEELGDTLWYIGLACDALGISLDEVLTLNIEKLRKRYGDKFTEKSALNRDIDNEMSHY